MKTPSRLIILLAGLVLCTVCGVLYAWSIFVVPLEQAFGWQRPETSLTFTFMITFFSLGMFAGGKLLRFGPARAVQIGGALLCVGLLWASRIDSVIGLYLSYGVVSGFGIGIVNLVPAAVCLRWYPERKGLVSGLLTMALALGTLLFGTVGAGWLIGKVGVSSTFMALAVLFLGIIVLGSLFLRMPEAAPGKEEGDGVGLRDMLHTPSYWMIWGWMLTIQIGGLMIIGHIVPYALECGLTAAQAGLGTLLFGTVGAGWLIGKVGVSSTFMALAVLFLGIIVLGSLFLRMPEAAPGKEEGDGVGLRDMLHTPSYWMIWGWMLTIQIGGLMIIGHIVPYALECGLTAAQAGLGMGVYAIANGVGRLFFGYVHDRFGRAWGMGLDAVFMGCGLVLLAALPSRFGMAGFLIAAVPVALAFGGTIPQLAALIMAFFGPRHFGVNYGFSTSPLMVASVCGPFIGGLIRAWSGDYLVALYVAAAITLLGVAPAVVLREKAHKRESVAREGCPSPASLSSQNG